MMKAMMLQQQQMNTVFLSVVKKILDKQSAIKMFLFKTRCSCSLLVYDVSLMFTCISELLKIASWTKLEAPCSQVYML